MTILRSLIRGERRSFSGPWGQYADGRIPPPTWDGAGAGIPITEDSALHLIDVYACVSLITDSVIQLPVDQFKVQGGARVEIDKSPVISRPDPEIERWAFFSQTVTSLALKGHAYWAHLDYDRLGYPTMLRCLHPDDCHKIRDRNGRIVLKLSNGQTLDRSQFTDIPLVLRAGSLVGLSPLDCARRGIRLATNVETFGDNWFNDGAAPSSVLETDANLEDDDALRIQAKWIASHGGRRRPAVLSGGLKWRAVTISPEESQFLESRKLNTSQIARIWRVPPHMIGDVERATSWGSGIEEQGIGYVVFTLGPYLHRMEQAMSRLTPRGQYVKFNIGGLLRGNARDRFTSYAIGRQWGWLSVNDIRRLEDQPPIDGGDVYLQPLNMIDAEEALKVLLAPKGAPA